MEQILVNGVQIGEMSKDQLLFLFGLAGFLIGLGWSYLIWRCTT